MSGTWDGRRTMIDLFAGLGGFTLAGLPHGLGALGDGIVHAVAAQIIAAMIQAEQ